MNKMLAFPIINLPCKIFTSFLAFSKNLCSSKAPSGADPLITQFTDFNVSAVTSGCMVKNNTEKECLMEKNVLNLNRVCLLNGGATTKVVALHFFSVDM